MFIIFEYVCSMENNVILNDSSFTNINYSMNM